MHVASVGAVNGPLEFELRVGARALRLKAESPAERERWMGALSAYLASHEEERTLWMELMRTGSIPLVKR